MKSIRILFVAVLVSILAFPAFAGRKRAVVSPSAPDNGTTLTVTVDAPVVTCNPDGTGASVTAAYTLLSTGSADSAVVTASIDGVDYSLPTVASGDVTTGGGWTISGRTKTAEGTFSISLPNGSYTLTICATQSGSQGREPKKSCSAPVAVTINCTSTSACANVGPFGEVPANRNLCKANAEIEIQFRGDFGETATLVITGPDDFAKSVLVDRAGDSCNYHYNWNPASNQPAGTYTFTVNDSLTFSATLICDGGRGNPHH